MANLSAGRIKPEDVYTPPTDVLETILKPRIQIPSYLLRKIGDTSTIRTGYDSITAKNIPANASIAMGYGDGLYQWSAADWARFSQITVEIAVNPTHNLGKVYDCETGNGEPADAVPWVKMRRAAGIDPTIYCGQNSWWEQIIQAFVSAGVEQPHYWVANYDGVQTIPAGAIAKQYADPGQYDLSCVAAYWPGVDPTPPPTPTNKSGDEMRTFIFTTTGQPAIEVDDRGATGIPDQVTYKAILASNDVDLWTNVNPSFFTAMLKKWAVATTPATASATTLTEHIKALFANHDEEANGPLQNWDPSWDTK